jgi:hypothetical protein
VFAGVGSSLQVFAGLCTLEALVSPLQVSQGFAAFRNVLQVFAGVGS